MGSEIKRTEFSDGREREKLGPNSLYENGRTCKVVACEFNC